MIFEFEIRKYIGFLFEKKINFTFFEKSVNITFHMIKCIYCIFLIKVQILHFDKV